MLNLIPAIRISLDFSKLIVLCGVIVGFGSFLPAGSTYGGVHRMTQGEVSMGFGVPGPSAELRVSRPKLVWEVWGKGTNQVTNTKMTLNGQEVNATYDPELKILLYRPEAPLPSGTYRATAQVTVEKLLTKDVSWSFTVRPDARPDPPPVTANEALAGETINDIRASASLPPLHLDAALCAGAQGHAHYMATNRVITHSERIPGATFLGKDPTTRVSAFGFAGSVYESVAYASNEPVTRTIRSLFDAPYHRIGLLQPASVAVGAGSEKGFVTVDTAFALSGAIVTSPAMNQALPNGAWEANEEPNPLTIHGIKGGPRVFVGYPIVVASFNRDVHVRSGSGGLSNSSGDVECLINSPDKDGDLTDALFIIPRHILPPATYSAWAELIFDDGTNKRISWTFIVKN